MSESAGTPAAATAAAHNDAPVAPAPLQSEASVSSEAAGAAAGRKRPRESMGTSSASTVRAGGSSGFGGGGGGGGGDRSRSIHVSNIPPQVDDALLYELGVQCGPVTKIWLPRAEQPEGEGGDAAPVRSSRFGFVEFADTTSVQYACRVLDGLAVFGQRLKVQQSGGQDAANAPGTGHVFVRPLDDAVDKWDLYDLGSVAGPLIDAKLPTDGATGRHRGFGFLVYETLAAAQTAIKVLDGIQLAGRSLQVKISDSKQGSAAAAAAAGDGDSGDGKKEETPFVMLPPKATTEGGTHNAATAAGITVTPELLLGLRREAAAKVAQRISRALDKDGLSSYGSGTASGGGTGMDRLPGVIATELKKILKPQVPEIAPPASVHPGYDDRRQYPAQKQPILHAQPYAAAGESRSPASGGGGGGMLPAPVPSTASHGGSRFDREARPSPAPSYSDSRDRDRPYYGGSGGTDRDRPSYGGSDRDRDRDRPGYSPPAAAASVAAGNYGRQPPPAAVSSQWGYGPPASGGGYGGGSSGASSGYGDDRSRGYGGSGDSGSRRGYDDGPRDRHASSSAQAPPPFPGPYAAPSPWQQLGQQQYQQPQQHQSPVAASASYYGVSGPPPPGSGGYGGVTRPLAAAAAPYVAPLLAPPQTLGYNGYGQAPQPHPSHPHLLPGGQQQPGYAYGAYQLPSYGNI